MASFIFLYLQEYTDYLFSDVTAAVDFVKSDGDVTALAAPVQGGMELLVGGSGRSEEEDCAGGRVETEL